jgi:hypothetical protein
MKLLAKQRISHIPKGLRYIYCESSGIEFYFVPLPPLFRPKGIYKIENGKKINIPLKLIKNGKSNHI